MSAESESESDMLTPEQVQDAEDNRSPDVIRTPLLRGIQFLFPELSERRINLNLKLETMQTTGSFKFRGVRNQMRFIPAEVKSGDQKLVTLSAGNYGKAFGHVTQALGLKGLCLVPDMAPSNRVNVIESYGVEVMRLPNVDLAPTAERYIREEGYHNSHPFDDHNLIAGYTSLGFEILDDCPDVDVVLVCCGGGGVLAGVSFAIRQRRPQCRVYGVEPAGAPTMFESFKAGHAVSIPTVKSVASGLSPPFAGKITYKYCRNYVDEILLVSESEIRSTVKKLYNSGLVVEPAGSASLAAILARKVPDIEGKNVVAVLTGSNVTPEEMVSLCQSAD